jgi:predicted AAA+ superfamily ATPase
MGGLPAVRKREFELPLEPMTAVSVLGPRRAGKTYLLCHTLSRLLAKGVPKQNTLYVDFEHPRLTEVKAEDLDNMLGAFYELSRPDPDLPVYLFLDEMQNVRDYGRWFRKRLNARFYISGSTSRLSSKGVAEELRGRSVDFTVYPLSFREYLDFKDVTVDRPELVLYNRERRGLVLSMPREYLRFGAYPAVALEREEPEKIRLLRAYFNSVVARDFARSQPALAEPLVKFVVQNYAGYFSVNRVYNYLRSLGYRVGKEKVLESLNTGVECYFIYPLELFVKSERRRQMNLKKLYVVDTGYLTALGYGFFIGRSMENAVMLELKRREKEVYYWKEYGRSQGQEVDFVVSNNYVAEELIRVTYAEDTVHARELRAPRKAGEETGAKRLTLITWDHYSDLGEIRIIPL